MLKVCIKDVPEPDLGITFDVSHIFISSYLYITSNSISEDSVCKEVSVAVNEAETRLVFVDHRHGEMSVSFIIIFSCNTKLL